MKIPVLITRTQPGADKTEIGVDALGLTPIVSPALTLQADPAVTLPEIDKFSGLIFTSANGVKFYAERDENRDLPAWCVGPATAAAASEVGFDEVHESAGDAKQLAAFIASTIGPPEKPLLHIANAAAKGDLAAALKMRRYKVSFSPLYHAGTSAALSDDASKLLDSKKPGILLVHSAKGAAAFLQLAADKPLSQLIAVVISNPAASALKTANIEHIHIAKRPNERALMDALSEAVATLSA